MSPEISAVSVAGRGACAARSRQPRRAPAARFEREGQLRDERPRADAVQSELELDHDAEVAATATQAPEQIWVLIGGCPHDVAVRGDERVGHDVVACQAGRASEPPHASAQRQPADAGVGHVPGRGGQPEGLGGAVQGAEHRAALHAGPQRDRIDGDAAKAGEVDHQPAVRNREAGDVVTAATHADLQVVLTRRAHCGDDVSDRGALDDQRRAVVDHCVPDPPGGVIPGCARGQEEAVEVQAASDAGGLGCGRHGAEAPRNRSP